MIYVIVSDSRKDDMPVALTDRALSRTSWWTRNISIIKKFSSSAGAESVCRGLRHNNPRVETLAWFMRATTPIEDTEMRNASVEDELLATLESRVEDGDIMLSDEVLEKAKAAIYRAKEAKATAEWREKNPAHNLSTPDLIAELEKRRPCEKCKDYLQVVCGNCVWDSLGQEDNFKEAA